MEKFKTQGEIHFQIINGIICGNFHYQPRLPQQSQNSHSQQFLTFIFFIFAVFFVLLFSALTADSFCYCYPTGQWVVSSLCLSSTVVVAYRVIVISFPPILLFLTLT